MLKYTLPATALLVVGLSACLDEPTGQECETHPNPITGMAGDTVITQVGLRYLVQAEGTSQTEARWCAGADVHYVGTLLNGTEFDRSSAGDPYAFTPGADLTIAGFAYGVVGMKVGEQRRLIIPPNLAYGAQGSGQIPPNATVVFDVELVSTD